MRKFSQWLGRLALSLAIALAFGYGFYGLVTYVTPLRHSDFTQARKSLVADDSEVLINGAAQAYERGRLGEATKVFELVLERMISKSGQYSWTNRWKLERVYFMLGKCYHKQKQLGKAAENYRETLRLNPGHLEAKYNLEMIQGEGGGKGDGDGGGKGGEGGTDPTNKLPPKI